MAKDFNKNDFEELAKKFNVSPVICEEYCKYNDTKIQPRIKKSYLAPLISVVKDLIIKRLNENDRLNCTKPEKESAALLRRYDIALYERQSFENRETITMKFPHGAVIVYDPSPDEKKICTSIARELGKLLIEHRIISGSKDANSADLFAHFVLNC